MHYEKRFVEARGRRIAYVEAGDPAGDPIVFLHGNPTSSYLWRNVIPELESSGRCIAPDLVGMGDSEKLPAELGAARYSFHVHYEFLRATLAALGINSAVTLVIHDWGSALGFHWARHHSDAVKAIAYMEGIVCPISWSDWPEDAGIFKSFRGSQGEELILERNLFIEGVLPNAIIRDLGEEEMAEYRRPFLTPEDRQPTLNWPRNIPIDGQPADVVKVVEVYGEWLETSTNLPKLFINADPGSILVGRQRDYCRGWPNQREVTVPGLHFVQEDAGPEIGRAVASFLAGL